MTKADKYAKVLAKEKKERELIELRDRIACSAITGLLANKTPQFIVGTNNSQHILAAEAYQIADAALRQREVKP